MNERTRALLAVFAVAIAMAALVAKRAETQGQIEYMEIRGGISTTAPTAASVALGGLGWTQGRRFLQLNPDGSVLAYTPK